MRGLRVWWLRWRLRRVRAAMRQWDRKAAEAATWATIRADDPMRRAHYQSEALRCIERASNLFDRAADLSATLRRLEAGA